MSATFDFYQGFYVTSDYGNQFLNLSHNEEIFEQPLVLQQTTPIPTTITTPPINTGAPAITTAIQEITPFIALQLRVTKLEQDMSEVKKFDHSADVLASIQSQVPLVVDKYLGIKLDNALLKTLERHTADLVEKYSVLPYSLFRAKFDLKSVLFKFMHKNKSTNRNPANYRLYHALMEALIEDENAMDKEVADTVKDHKRKHDGDDDDDDDDEGPSAGSNQGNSTKKRRKKEFESTQNLSTTKESSKGKDPNVGSKTGKSAPAKDLVKEPTKKRSGRTPIRSYANDSDTTTCKADLEGPAFMMVKGFHENIISLQFQIEECHKLLTNQIDLVNPEGHRIVPDISNSLPLGGPLALSISKLKAALYQDFGLEELVPSLWIESEQVYDISAAYGITHWCVISIKTYERYGYNYLREIVLCRADYNEYKISEKDFKSLHPNDFEDLNILHIQGKLDHLPKQDKVNLHNAVSLWTRNIVIRKCMEDLQLGIESYQTKLNLEQLNWDAYDFPFKEDYTIVFKPRAVIYKDMDDNRKIMRIDEVHKFSDGMLTRIKEKLDFMVKDFKLFKFNKGMENRKWTEDDKRRSEDFIEVIERRLKIRRIFRSLESFVGGRLRDIDYRLISRTE
ncbi:hypothetical protein Tco_0456175 [Tanacetum coccineum]